MQTKNKFKNKIVLITGASSGIGEACARRFAVEGANLILCGRRMERLQKLSDELQKSFNIKIHHAQFDVTKRESVEEFFNTIPPTFKNIDILINNAGLALGLDAFYEADVADWEQMIGTNVNGLLYMTKFVLPGMMQRNQGHIFNIGSIAGLTVYPKGAVYCATKHAVRVLTQGLRMDLCGTKIKVSLIEPGMVKTEFSVVRYKGDQERADHVYSGLSPLLPEDIAETIFYCASVPPHVNIDEVVMMSQDQASISVLNRK